VHGAAHRFLAAFLRYEVGDLSPSVRRELRATAGSTFLVELLARPPHQISGLPPIARIVRLRITHLSPVPPRALLSGSARRGARLEQFSFLLELERGRWRVVGPGE
jgi:hypothetical protein